MRITPERLAGLPVGSPSSLWLCLVVVAFVVFTGLSSPSVEALSEGMPALTKPKKPARKVATRPAPKSAYKIVRDPSGLMVTKGPPGLSVTSEQIKALSADYP